MWLKVKNCVWLVGGIIFFQYIFGNNFSLFIILRMYEFQWVIDAQSATEGYEKVLGDQLRNDPTLFISEGIGALTTVLSHKAAFPGVY